MGVQPQRTVSGLGKVARLKQTNNRVNKLNLLKLYSTPVEIKDGSLATPLFLFFAPYVDKTDAQI